MSGRWKSGWVWPFGEKYSWLHKEAFPTTMIRLRDTNPHLKLFEGLKMLVCLSACPTTQMTQLGGPRREHFGEMKSTRLQSRGYPEDKHAQQRLAIVIFRNASTRTHPRSTEFPFNRDSYAR